ncbi:hypothetical protein SUGI_0953880 [Cryptomeria japonica]|nr:hypothetical protein SUGI_0953880 [Cryptomeria japonica]
MARASAIDRLSALSDDVLLNHILSKISYRDVVRSSLLSQRWRLLWTKIPRLKFCPEDFEKQKDGRIQAIINNALLHLDTRLSCLELTVALDDPKAAYINNWIRLAAEKQVERMDIHICNRDPKTGKRISNGASPMMELGDSIFSCENLTVLTVQYIQLPKIPTNVGVFRSLKALYYFAIPNLDDAMFEGFMDLCPHLQDLWILGCLALKNLIIRSSNLLYILLGALRPDISLQLTCPRLMEISLIDCGQYAGLKLLQGISRVESVKKVILQNYNTGNAVNPGMPSITVLNSFPGLEELTIHGQCFQEMISDEMPIGEVTLPNLKMVRAHIGPDKGAQAVIFWGFLLRNCPLSVTRVFLPKHCPRIMRNNILNLKRDLSKSRLSTATRTWFEEEGNGESIGEDQHALDSDVLSSVLPPREQPQEYLYGQGTRAVEIKSLEQARELTKGNTVYVNLEPSDCHGDVSRVSQTRAILFHSSLKNLNSENTVSETRIRGEQSRLMEKVTKGIVEKEKTFRSESFVLVSNTLL